MRVRTKASAVFRDVDQGLDCKVPGRRGSEPLARPQPVIICSNPFRARSPRSRWNGLESGRSCAGWKEKALRPTPWGPSMSRGRDTMKGLQTGPRGGNQVKKGHQGGGRGPRCRLPIAFDRVEVEEDQDPEQSSSGGRGSWEKVKGRSGPSGH